MNRRLALGNEQLVRTLLERPVGENELVLVLTHHPLNWLRDESAVRQIVQRRAHVHLCGHVHQAESVLTSSGAGGELLRVVAGAVHELATPGAAPVRFEYNLGSLHAGADDFLEVRIWPRVWSASARQFRTDVDTFQTPSVTRRTAFDCACLAAKGLSPRGGARPS